MVRLENVIDTRTDKFHSVAIVKEKYAKWFIDADPETHEPIVEAPSEEEEEEVGGI